MLEYLLFGINYLVHFQPELNNEKVKYNLVTNINTYNPLRNDFFEWGSMLRDAFKQ